MNIETKQSAADRLRQELASFYGSEVVYRHGLNKRVLYTEGVQRFAEAAGAYWFLDILATEPDIIVEAQEFAVVRLQVSEYSTAVIVVTDGGRDGNAPKVVFRRALEFTDCPPGTWEFFFENMVIMLPQER